MRDRCKFNVGSRCAFVELKVTAWPVALAFGMLALTACDSANGEGLAADCSRTVARGGWSACVSGDAAAATANADDVAKADNAVNRKEVEPEVAKAAPELAEFRTRERQENLSEKRRAAPRPHLGRATLSEAVAAAVLSHPLMGAAAARVARAGADLDFADTAFKPTLSVNGGSGFATLGQYYNSPKPFSNAYLPGTWRTDLGLSFRQLVFDFGAAQEEVERNKALIDSEKLKLADQAEDIALRTVNAYFNLLEWRETLTLADHTVAEERKLAELVKLNQQNGNAAAADVDRINTKIFEIEAMRSGVDSSYRVAMDEFRRLTGFEPQNIKRPANKASVAPKTAELAIEEAKAQSPLLLAIRAEGVSIEHQANEQEDLRKPQVSLQVDATVKHYMGFRPAAIGVIDNRAMFVVDYKIFDGGAQEAQMSHIRANQSENRFNELDQMETLELNIRRFYETIAADKVKLDVARRGVKTALKVNVSYLEQFKAGKRTIFEVLDSYTSIYNMQKSEVEGEFESLRSQYGVLRNLGRLNREIVGR